MKTRALPRYLAALATCLVAVASTGVAQAVSNACPATAQVGVPCSTAGPGGNGTGACEVTSASFGPGCADIVDGSADETDGGPSTCLTCVVVYTVPPQGCGSEGPGNLSGAAFMPAVSGCCSVAGRNECRAGLGFLLGAGFLGLALVQRRRRTRP